eukprot:CAMPEP_0180627456 /NCGR_PEP_ID=MMETSP1037_2-20121125/38382_1 /TAXON_ID=632150 /ORGANISM="Azadinium spinosum, Strain 3D9" /LENGTH=32 /DNA_ID= /DNA_START= /DNA_END= /DNA_ORIENTATION=
MIFKVTSAVKKHRKKISNACMYHNASVHDDDY